MAEIQTVEELPGASAELWGMMAGISMDVQEANQPTDQNPAPREERFPDPGDVTTQGKRTVPSVIEISGDLLDAIDDHEPIEEMATKVARETETQFAQAIRSGELVGQDYFPANKPTTEAQKARKGQPANRPLLATGELVGMLEQHELPVRLEWSKGSGDSEILNVFFGWSKGNDPTHKYADMMFGATCVGPNHSVRVPSRYPRITQSMQRSIENTIANWISSKPTRGVLDGGKQDEFINLMSASDPFDFLDFAGFGDR